MERVHLRQGLNVAYLNPSNHTCVSIFRHGCEKGQPGPHITSNMVVWRNQAALANLYVKKMIRYVIYNLPVSLCIYLMMWGVKG